MKVFSQTLLLSLKQYSTSKNLTSHKPLYERDKMVLILLTNVVIPKQDGFFLHLHNFEYYNFSHEKKTKIPLVLEK